MVQHLKYSLPDFALCLLMSVGLAVNVAQSFLLPAALSADVPRMALVAALTLAALVLLSYNRGTAIAGAAGGILLLIVFGILSWQGMAPVFTEADDPEENMLLWYMVCVLCAAAVYLLSRTRLGAWVLLVGGGFVLAYLLLLEYTFYLWGALVYLGCAGAWLCFVGYRRGMLRISAAKPALLPMLGWCVGISAACLGIGVLLWVGIIRPLQPPTRDLEIIHEIMSVELEEVLGIYREVPVINPYHTSPNMQEELQQETNQATEEENAAPPEAQEEQTEEHRETQETADTPTPLAEQPGATRHIRYSGLTWAEKLALTFLIAIPVIALLVLFLQRRRLWYKYKTKQMDDRGYILFFYRWYLKKLRVMQLPPPGARTPRGYAAAVEPQTRFLNETGVTWGELTDIFARLVYGGREAEAGDREKFERFYRGFVRCCRRKSGAAWVLRALRI